MTYEKDIPEYAMQPAKAPKVIPAEAVYHTQTLMCPAEEQTVIYRFEEDILVPDTKADMRQILLMDAHCDISPSEKKVSPKTDDLLNLTGIITIQTLYAAEGESQLPVSIISKVPYKYQWSLNPSNQGEGVFSCCVKNLDYMIVNERKFQVKITLEFTGRLFCKQEFRFFDGLKDETLETRKEQVQMSCLELVKQDTVSVNETFKGRDSSVVPQQILKQDFTIAENYLQVTTDKVVINGFIFCSLLYCGEKEDDGVQAVCQHEQRIEFTQFIPIDKDHRGKTWNTVKTFFEGKNLEAEICREEEEPSAVSFRVKGDVSVRAELYGLYSREVAVDAYHREKNFQCSFTRKKVSGAMERAVSEVQIREMVPLPEGAKGAAAIYCMGTPLDCEGGCGNGKITAEGSVLCDILWKDQEENFHSIKRNLDFRSTLDSDSAGNRKQAVFTAQVKSATAELIGEKQIEVICTVFVQAEIYEDCEIIMLEQPCFSEKTGEKEYPMVIVTLKKGETIWDLAKRYRTTEAHIRTANRLETAPEAGTRLLVTR